MTISVSASSVKKKSYSALLFLGLIAAGLAGNYFKLTLFLNVHFLFGSVFAMLALQFFGRRRGIIAAAAIASYTYVLWHHPYAIVILTAEVAIVGWYMGRRTRGLVLADTLFWLVVGMPLVYFFYHIVMHIPAQSTYIMMTKQAVNGIANALIARLIFTGYSFRSGSSLTSYKDIIYSLLAFFVLCPALVILVVEGITDFSDTEHEVRTSLTQTNQQVKYHFDSWLEERKVAISSLAELAASKPPEQMQSYLELVRKTDTNFLRIGIADKEATSVAFSPLVDETGKSTLGVSFAERPYIAILKRTLSPLFSEIFMGKVGESKPRVVVLVPVITSGKYNGYIFGVLALDRLQTYLNKGVAEYASYYTLIDKNGAVIMTNRSDQKIMAPFMRREGTLSLAAKGISLWTPAFDANASVAERWSQSTYVSQATVGTVAEWKLILEQPVEPFQKALYKKYTGKLTLLFLILLGALTLAEFLSRKVVAALGELRTLTHKLPVNIAQRSKEIIWPESGILESNHLIKNFREMAESLDTQFNEVRKINELLEHRVEVRTEELKKSENLLRTLILTIPDLVWLKDTDGVYLLCNPVFERFYGAKESDIIGKKDSDFVDKELADFFREHDFKAMAAGKPSRNEEWITYADDGHRAFVEAIKTPMYNTAGEITGVLGISRDLTERKQHEEELLQAKAAAETANTAKSQFLANMSHEIRTPMNGVLGMTQLLEMTDLTQEQRGYVAALKLSGKNLLSLINDILDLSKIEAGKITIELAEFGLHHCINDIVMMQRSVIRDKGLLLDVHVADNLPPILIGDQLRTKQILLNLVGNAIKFTKDGAITITAHVLEQYESSVLVQIAICDKGIGISPTSLETIFMPFVQEDGSITRQFGGTGLGLSISLRLAELMGGSISVESTQGLGSCFSVTLPFTCINRAEVAVEAPQTTVTTWNGPPLKILLAEDNPINSSFGTTLLQKLGHEVVAVETGRECLIALEQGLFDLVLMDIQMPIMNGEETLIEIRRKEQGTDCRLPVIALTAYALRGEKERFLLAGFDGYISKPLAIKELVCEMIRVLTR